MAIAADLALDLACSLDPVILAEQAGISPDPWQADVLRSTAPRVLLLCSRQAGKSTITAVLAVHCAVYEPGSLVLLLSRHARRTAGAWTHAAGTHPLLAQIIPGLGGGDAAGDAPAIHGHGGAVHPAAIPDRTAVLPYSDPRAT